MTGNLSLYLFLNKYRLSFNSCGCMFAYQLERESRKTLKPLYRTRSPCKQHRINSVRLECWVQIYSRTVRLIKAILPHVQANKSAVLIMIISSNILSDSCTKKTEKLNRMMPLEVVSQAAQLITTGGRFLFRATQWFFTSESRKTITHTMWGSPMLSHTHTHTHTHTYIYGPLLGT